MAEELGYRVLGIDPGLNVTGYALAAFAGRGVQIVEAGALRVDSSGDLADRVARLHEDLRELLADLRPDVMAIEQLYAHYKHPRTSILMAHARWVILLAACQAGVDVRHVSATNVKKSLTGHGHATKQQIQRAIQEQCGLAEAPEPPDVADAMAIALCAGRHL
jgi:crossover junction endodeoxyribonuclease RuvC